VTNQKLLDGFDLNAPSSNGNTAVDWVKAGEYHDTIKIAIMQILKAHHVKSKAELAASKKL